MAPSLATTQPNAPERTTNYWAKHHTAKRQHLVTPKLLGDTSLEQSQHTDEEWRNGQKPKRQIATKNR